MLSTKTRPQFKRVTLNNKLKLTHPIKIGLAWGDGDFSSSDKGQGPFCGSRYSGGPRKTSISGG